jgi:hypothetical protein
LYRRLCCCCACKASRENAQQPCSAGAAGWEHLGSKSTAAEQFSKQQLFHQHSTTAAHIRLESITNKMYICFVFLQVKFKQLSASGQLEALLQNMQETTFSLSMVRFNFHSTQKQLVLVVSHTGGIYGP